MSKKKARPDQRPLQIATDDKVVLYELRKKTGGTLKDLVGLAVRELSERPKHWVKWRLGILTDEEYEALEAVAEARRATTPAKQKRTRVGDSEGRAG